LGKASSHWVIVCYQEVVTVLHRCSILIYSCTYGIVTNHEFMIASFQLPISSAMLVQTRFDVAVHARSLMASTHIRLPVLAGHSAWLLQVQHRSLWSHVPHFCPSPITIPSVGVHNPSPNDRFLSSPTHFRMQHDPT
jgi:hypothetical protein